MKLFKPIILKESYYSEIEKKIDRFFFDVFLKPVLTILKQNEVLQNSKDAVADAIARGKIYYEDGYIYGKFTAEISSEIKKLGGEWNKQKKAWKIPQGKLTPNSLMAIAQVNMRMQRISEEIIKTLDGIDINDKMKQLNLLPEFEETVQKLDISFREIARSIEIKPELTQPMKEKISKEWKNNLDLYISKFTQEETLKLRDKVQKNVFAGNRAAALVKTIEDTHKTTKAKAKFLARQETSLLVSKFRESRFSEAGVTKYIWRNSGDQRVVGNPAGKYPNPTKGHGNHWDREGKVFLWSDPPFDGHPGSAFGCRCIAIPFLE